MLTADTLVKFTRTGRRATQTDFVWPKPRTWAPPVEGRLRQCSNGYHVCRIADCLPFTNEELWLAEVREDQKVFGAEVIARETRLLKQIKTWNPKTARLFACDCAQRVWPIYQKLVPADKRPLVAIRVARKFALGLATQTEIAAAWDAARDAARNAARAAAGAAAGAAARAAARDAAGDAAGAAAGAAAWAATGAAAGAAAGAAESKWQVKRLLRYLNGELPCPR